MTANLTRGVLQVLTNDPVEINDALRRIRQELDEIEGLNGPVQVFDRIGIGAPVASTDAAQLANVPDVSKLVTIDGVQTLIAQKTFKNTALRMTDSSDTLVHAFGTST